MAAGASPLGIVVGLAAEARIARRLGGCVEIGGGTAAGARAAARRVADSGACALVSFGLAGGLDPSLRPGDVLVPETVLTGGRILCTDPGLCRSLGGGTSHLLLGGDRIIVDRLAKQALWEQTGCAAVDIESGAVALVAAERGLRFAVLRAVCDPAARSLPLAALAGLDAHGAVALGRVLRAVAAHPAELGALIALAGDAVRARRALLQRVGRIAAHGPFTISE